MRACDLATYRGDTFTIDLAFTDPDANDAPIDITGWEVFFTAKRSPSDADADAVIQGSTSSHLDPTEGITSIIIAADVMDTVPPATYSCDVQVKDAFNNITTVFSGSLKVLADITRRIV